MNMQALRELLAGVSQGRCSVEEALGRLKKLPFEELDCATLDHHRQLRRGAPEVIFGQGKTEEEIETIMAAMDAAGENILVTRLARTAAERLIERFPRARYHARARLLTLENQPLEPQGRGPILVITAGTSDWPVAEEALITARMMGHEARQIKDVGVAGLHRLIGRLDELEKASVFVVVAGMEGALPSVVAGLVSRPVIAVPTSVGYGASFGGLAALLGMLNSCAAGVGVVNIDNGFGAGRLAAMINQA